MKLSKPSLIAALVIVYIAVFILSFSIGRFPITPPELIKILLSRIFPITQDCPPELIKILLSRIFPITQDWSVQAEAVVFNIRLPRIIISSLIGAGLSLSGLIYQMIFRNPMVSPDVLGTSTGAGFGAAIALLIALPSHCPSLSSCLPISIHLWASCSYACLSYRIPHAFQSDTRTGSRWHNDKLNIPVGNKLHKARGRS